MGTKNNPGSYDCYANADPDEPLFVLRGNDPTAGSLVRQWASWAQVRGKDAEKVAEARRCADAMDAWAAKAGKAPLPNPRDAVVGAAMFMQDYADDCGLCAVCNGHVEEDGNDGTSDPCGEDCTGRTLRDALKAL